MVIGDDVIVAEKTVQLDRIEAIGTGVGSHTMHNEVNVTAKVLDLGLVAILAAVFDCQRVKL